ncbi:MAG: AIR synthase family protein [Candidatus Thorarchaeota archaeon]
MKPGKIPPSILESVVFKYLGSNHPNLILGPSIGQDASLIKMGDRILVASTDPITGSIEDVGWLSVHINANDIATFGVEPQWFLNSIMLPPDSGPSELERIMKQIQEAAASLNIVVAGGHTEITEGIENPIIAGFMLGETREGSYVTSAGAQPGDAIVMTKTAAIEGTAILAAEGYDFLVQVLGKSVVDQARELRKNISVVREGVTAFKTGYLTAMHDPTEGGIANGIHELCDASHVGCLIYPNLIPVHSATKSICESLKIDHLQLISSGSMLLTCRKAHSNEVLKALASVSIPAVVIGETLKDPQDRLIESTQGKTELVRPESDALWTALHRFTRS